MQKPANAHLSWHCLYNLTLRVLIKHSLHASFPLITSCWVNWIIKILIKLQFISQSSNTVKPCILSISSREQIGKGWCAEQEFSDVSSIMRWNGKVWSGLSIWSLNPPVPLHRVGLLFFCLSILHCRFYCNPLRYAAFQSVWSLWTAPLIIASNTICRSIDFLGSSSHIELAVLLRHKVG